MRDATFSDFGAPSVVLVTEDVPTPVQAEDQVLIRHVASSVNRIDCHQRGGYDQHMQMMLGALNFPIILGNRPANGSSKYVFIECGADGVG